MKSDGCRLAQPPPDELDVLDVLVVDAVGSVLLMVLMPTGFD
jgi:hypothetical protein